VIQPASKTFEKAIALIERDGWVQAQIGNPWTGYCADGAMWWANTDGDSRIGPVGVDGYHAARTVAATYVLDRYGRALVPWNDDPARTKEEVLDLFRQLMAVAKGMEQ
jgi:hypothetical protein